MDAAETTGDELRRELEALRARLAELEHGEAERKRSEDVLLLAQFTVDHGAMPTFWIGPDARFLRVNDAACRSLGYSREELLSMTVPDIDPEFPPERWPGHWREVKQRGTLSFESRHSAKNGRVFPVEVFVNYLEFRGREYNVSFARDITERKRAEELLSAANDRLQYLLTATSVAIYTAGISGNYAATSITDNVKVITGYEPREFIEGSGFWIDHVHPDDRERALSEASCLFESGSHTYEYRFLHKDGGYIWMRDEMKLVTDQAGNPVEIVGYWVDITERKRVEEVLRTADRLAAMGTVVAGVAHEINSPLTTICGLAELLAKDKSLGGRPRETADEIVEQAIRCGKIVEDMLGFARVGRISFQPVQVNALVKRCLGLSRCTHRFDDVEIVEEYDAAIPETMADPYRLEQVFINIIRNAGDSLADSGPTKRLTVRSKRSAGRIRVEFTDTGPGIADPGKVFDPFYTTKVTGEGTGLGLSVSLGIIQDHGGTLTAKNMANGARCTVTLPVRPLSSGQVPTSG